MANLPMDHHDDQDDPTEETRPTGRRDGLWAHRHAALTTIGRSLLEVIGEDPAREGLHDTPERFARWWEEFIAYDPGTTDTTFEAVRADQMVVVSGIRVWSLCEHHLLPFWCDLTIAYIPHQKILGLSKLARLAHKYAHRLQVQERLVDEIATNVEDVSGSADVAVIGRGEHMCMTMRGIKTPATMTTSVLRGAFRSDPSVRAEFLSLAR